MDLPVDISEYCQINFLKINYKTNNGYSSYSEEKMVVRGTFSF
jgi:hypothetical protein